MSCGLEAIVTPFDVIFRDLIQLGLGIAIGIAIGYSLNLAKTLRKTVAKK